jgi:hypothetical protein
MIEICQTNTDWETHWGIKRRGSSPESRQGVGGAAPLSPDDVTIITITLSSTPNRPDATERHFSFRVTFFFPFHPPPRDTPPPN